MPIYPPRNNSTRKAEIFKKRVFEFQRLHGTDENEEKLADQAEKVRTARLNLLKARLNLSKSYSAEKNLMKN